MYHVSIDFLPWGVHPLHRVLSLSNRWERLASKLSRLRKASLILRHSIPRQDRQWHVAAALVQGQEVSRAAETAQS